jgi:hypothetical protein
MKREEQQWKRHPNSEVEAVMLSFEELMDRLILRGPSMTQAVKGAEHAMLTAYGDVTQMRTIVDDYTEILNPTPEPVVRDER